MIRRQQQHDQSSVFYELSSLVMSILRLLPPPFPFSDQASRRRISTEITPVGFAFLLLGISLALMLCGSVTFFIGFLMMPWVVGLVVFFYSVAIFSSLSMIGRSILYFVATRKDI